MLLLDVNVLVHAYRPEHPRRDDFRRLLERLADGPEAYAVSPLVLSGFLRIVTHPRVFRDPDTPDKAMAFAEAILEPPHCVQVSPGTRHWGIFRDLCVRTSARGNLIPDAYLAALAIEHGCEWITTDHDYARFPGLRWRHPLEK
ncbi:MAG: type II toxin-antitoxin system VapC family toxin [Planctomycetes bacterium]|nr:type II toxin-antitoxin system VapC family toxin [Planctomycetota bacterium]